MHVYLGAYIRISKTASVLNVSMAFTASTVQRYAQKIVNPAYVIRCLEIVRMGVKNTLQETTVISVKQENTVSTAIKTVRTIVAITYVSEKAARARMVV